MVRESRDQDPGGRYFSMLLEQVYNEAPDVMRRALLPGAPTAAFAGSLARTEWEYAPGRIADLAVFGPGDVLLALIEVKEKDQNGLGGPAQLEDYLSFCDREGVRFSYVTKRSPSVECLDVLQGWGAKAVYYSDLYGAIYKQGSQIPLVRLFCDYLKEERVAYQPLVEDDLMSLKLLLLRSNNMSGRGHGKMKVAARTSAAASILDLVVTNAEVLGSAFYMRHRACFGQRFVPDFHFRPEIDFERLAKKYDMDPGLTFIDKNLVLNGHLAVYSEGRMKKIGVERSCYVWVGFSFELDKVGTLETRYLAGVGTNRDLFEDTIAIGKVRVDEVAALRSLAKLLSKQIEAALADDRYAGHEGLIRLRAKLGL